MFSNIFRGFRNIQQTGKLVSFLHNIEKLLDFLLALLLILFPYFFNRKRLAIPHPFSQKYCKGGIGRILVQNTPTQPTQFVKRKNKLALNRSGKKSPTNKEMTEYFSILIGTKDQPLSVVKFFGLCIKNVKLMDFTTTFIILFFQFYFFQPQKSPGHPNEKIMFCFSSVHCVFNFLGFELVFFGRSSGLFKKGSMLPFSVDLCQSPLLFNFHSKDKR